MTFLLCAYLFLHDGTMVQKNFPHLAISYEDCQALGKQKVLEMKQTHQDASSGAYMCIAEKQ